MKAAAQPADPSHDLLLARCWSEVVPGFQRRRRESGYDPYTCLVTSGGGGGRLVREVVYVGGSTDELPIQQSVTDLATGRVSAGWAMRSGMAEYLGVLWLGDRQFEAVPWQPFISWWTEVLSGGPKWKREFGTRVKTTETARIETVMIPMGVVREAVNGRLSFNLRDERAGALSVLERNWRSMDIESEEEEDWES